MKMNKIIQIGNVTQNPNRDNPSRGRVYSTRGVAPVITTCGGGNLQPHIIDSKNLIGEKQMRNSNCVNSGDTGYRIRKLTPKECFRLMGLKDEDFEKAKEVGISDSQLYKQAGNGIITNCCELLAEHLYKAQYDDTYVCADENFTKPRVG